MAPGNRRPPITEDPDKIKEERSYGLANQLSFLAGAISTGQEYELYNVLRNVKWNDPYRRSLLLTTRYPSLTGSYLGHFGAFLDLDTKFHMRLLELADNSLLTKLFESISHQIKLVRAYQKAPGVAKEAGKTHNEHVLIVSAIESRDVSGLRNALNTHFMNRRELVIKALEACTDH